MGFCQSGGISGQTDDEYVEESGQARGFDVQRVICFFVAQSSNRASLGPDTDISYVAILYGNQLVCKPRCLVLVAKTSDIYRLVHFRGIRTKKQ